jgi:NAD(P)-dependent dehydrogenase (short-subunit alcohol dehydrogenase family)
VKLSGKVAIVTGAASGIGQASAIVFAREGAKVVAVDVDQHRGEETAKAIRDEGGSAFFDRTDVSREEEVARMIGKTVARWGRIDILFNNAGIVLVKPLEETTEQEWDRVMSINLKAAFLAIKHVVPHLRRGGGGAILNTGSIGSMVGQLKTPAYIASKGAIALLTKTLALDYGRDHIRVNCLCPGITDTPMLRQHLGTGPEGEASIRERISRVPLGSILTPEDLARAALYLVSDDSVGVTGITHVVDGGLLAAAEYNIPLSS